MAGAEWDDLLGRLRAVIIAVADLVKEQDVTNTWELTDAGEPGIALQNLCAQLFEYGATLDRGVLEQIRRLAVMMELDADLLVEGLGPIDGAADTE